jgi:class 3 adenylate cyclase/pimeloyl-ACP methyl ester carboxylesterase
VPANRRIHYATVSGADVAYEVSGDGPHDLLFIPGLLNHIESAATVPQLAGHYERLSSFARVVLYDKRGTGLSGPLAGEAPTIEDRVDEALAVLDAAGSQAASVYATADGGPVGIVLAAMHPDRVRQLIVYGSSARLLETDDYPGLPSDLLQAYAPEQAFLEWGDDDNPRSLELMLPSQASDPAVRRAVAGMQRLAGSPRAVQRYLQVVYGTDVRDVLSMVRTPTLVLHVRGDGIYPLEQGRYLAREIPDARFVEINGGDHYYFWENAGRVADEIETFVTGGQKPPPSDRFLAILLFTDIVGSTRRLAAIGDEAWRQQLERHDERIEFIVSEHGGRVVDTTGDGVLAAFDGPSRAVRCARRLVEALSEHGLEIRAGLHAGEVESRGTNVAGIAVHIAARVCALAGAGEVLTTATLRDLTAGSGISFRDRGDQELRGVPGTWSLLEVIP